MCDFVTSPPCWSPKRSFCPVIGAKRRTLSWVHKQNKSFVLWSENGDVGTPALEHTQHKRFQQVTGEAALCQRGGGGVLAGRAHAPGVGRLCAQSTELRCWCSHFGGETLWSVRREVSAFGALWASETRGSTKEKKKG